MANDPKQAKSNEEDKKHLLSDVIDDEFEGDKGGSRPVNAVYGVGMNVQIVLGRARMPVSQLLSMSRGSVIELDKKIGQPVDVMVNDQLIAKGELVKVGDDRMGVTLTEVVKEFSPKASG
jgi:flagellar motor switch protein FliN/FliY